MKPKPRGLGPEYGEQFKDASVVAAYGARPAYPERLISLILDIVGTSEARILDLGCGTGELSRRLAGHVASVTAVDHSWRMIAAARGMPGGDAPNIDWLVGRVEDVPLTGRFNVAVAAESFHWFDWARVCRRLHELVSSSVVVLVEGRFEEGSPWAAELAALIAQYSTNRDFMSYDLVAELTSRSCFTLHGRTRIGPEGFRQSVDDYLLCLHSRNGLSRERMSLAQMHAFDEAARGLVSSRAREGMLDLEISTHVAWGLVDPFERNAVAADGV
jgi:SAM-dependent methyltransferase